MRAIVAQVGIVAVGALAHAAPAAAQAAHETARPYNIPAGPATDTIPEFARQAGINILVSADILDGVATNALAGALTTSEAVTRLLACTDLAGRVGASGTVVILKRAPSEPDSSDAATACGAAPALPELPPVLVVGTRAAQQSGIERKKNAATAMDSIVTEDVGSLPDRNIGEAISRMAGIALDRGDFGEGVNVAVRGNGPELTRVELDGQAVQSAGGSDMNGGGDGRAVEFRQLSADLIKSVDVVKGSTADMVEGSLGGSIIIKTRTGLDFKKPYASLRLGATQHSLNRQWQPDANVILSDKYLDGRLGLLLNASSTTLLNEGHSAQAAGNGNQGYFRLYDFDNSPDKTFSFQPGTVNKADLAASTPLLQSPLSGGGFFNSGTPLDIVTRSAAARTKEDCATAFPALGAAQLNAISPAARLAAQTQRGNELATCLNQWNDYTPSAPRYLVKREIDRRKNLDLRADFKVSDELTVYAKASYNKRHNDINVLAYSLGNLAIVNGVPNTVPGSVVVDAAHHLTQYTFQGGAARTDQLHDIGLTTAKYLQLGGSFKRGGLSADFFVGDAGSDFRRGAKRLSFTDYYGPATARLLSNGLWGYTFPETDPIKEQSFERYAKLFPNGASAAILPGPYNTQAVPAYTAEQQQAVTSSPNVTWEPQIRESGERTAKLDMAYAMPESVPFFKRIKSGFNLRDTGSKSWTINNGGYILRDPVGVYGQPGYVAPLVLPSPTLRSTLYGCQDTPGSLAPGGNKCQYGLIMKDNTRQAFDSLAVMTLPQFMDLLRQTMILKATPTSFFHGAKDSPQGLMDNWTQIDVEKVFSLVGIPNANFDCVKRCKASDGKVYDQPYAQLKERASAFYLMGDFSALPFGLELDGNVGVRYVRTRVNGTGMMTFVAITKTDAYDPLNRDAPGGIVTTRVSQATRTDAEASDILPSLNLALWLVPDQLVARYSAARTVARPPVSRLLPSGVCTFDERSEDDSEVFQKCSGTIGNPLLRAQQNVNQNLSLEYYPNRDTMFSAAVFRQRGKVGAAVPQGVSHVPLQAPLAAGAGAPFTDTLFDYSTWMNGAASSRTGLELGAKTAFTFLPSLLRHTGIDANYSKQRSKSSTENIVDLLTGAPLPPARESKYTYNWALWYDDGKLAARVAVQAVAAYFNCIASCGAAGVNNYPNAAPVRTGFPYNPGSPNFKDGTRYVDAKLSYKWRPNIEFFIEGRNLANATTSNSQGRFAPFADGTPNLLDFNYSGRRIMAGVTFRTM
ncbi:TonB-dependent receptor [Pseudoduganella aquatica]|uniref:TonB-dependent receptor n=1 Tax=Pseudoduganella aquatica TaxID=2660641 RepID=A0A7X4KL71_9BURK|nr:TonB-dependent receptor [Pseudoduganella aquatica]MYN06778.1 TonB-dependent receptor [Pseudoduganella aquatica]